MGACSWYIVRCWTFPDMSVCTCVALATMSVLCLLCGTQGLMPGVLIVACVRHSLAADTLIGTHCVRPLCTRGKIPNCVCGWCMRVWVCVGMRACVRVVHQSALRSTCLQRHGDTALPISRLTCNARHPARRLSQPAKVATPVAVTTATTVIHPLAPQHQPPTPRRRYSRLFSRLGHPAQALGVVGLGRHRA